MKIFSVLAALYIITSFYVLVSLFVEFGMCKKGEYNFELKRYHILKLIISPISYIIFFFIILFFYTIKFIFKAIGNFFKVIFEWLDQPFMNREKSKETI